MKLIIAILICTVSFAMVFGQQSGTSGQQSGNGGLLPDLTKPVGSLQNDTQSVLGMLPVRTTGPLGGVMARKRRSILNK